MSLRDRRAVLAIAGLTAALMILAILSVRGPGSGSDPGIARPSQSTYVDPFSPGVVVMETTAPTPEPGHARAGEDGPEVTSAPPIVVPPPRSPTPPPQEKHWRYAGVVMDAQGRPIPNVCIGIGPHGCKQFSPRTDDRGVYIIDFPEVNPLADYDLHFFVDGVEKKVIRVRPKAPATFNVVIDR